MSAEVEPGTLALTAMPGTMRGSSGAGWSSLAARRAHNPKVVGSNPTPATNFPFYINELASTLLPIAAAAQEIVGVLRDFRSHALSAALIRFSSSASE